MATSAEWKAAFDERIMGEQFVEVAIDCSDEDALEDATVAVLSGQEMRYSNASSIITTANVARTGTLESNLWVLDSSTDWASSNSTMGYVSLSVSDSDCTFSNTESEVPHYIPSIKITLDSVIDFDGLTIKWSELFNEWATDFSIEFLDTNETRILKKDVTGNKAIVYTCLDSVDDCKYIVITVTKWCLPGRRARIEKVIKGAILQFTKKDLMKFSFSKRESPINSELPSHVVDFTIHNYDGRYDGNGELAISDFLEKQNAVSLKYGITLTNGDIEYISGGTYFIDTWEVDSSGTKIAIKARDPFYFMSNQYWKSTYSLVGNTLESVAESILQDAAQEYGCVSTWDIDSDLVNITSISYLQDCTHATALQYVAQAAGMVLSYNGEKIVISPPDYTAQASQGQIKKMSCFGYPTYDLKALPNSVNCKIYTYNTDMVAVPASHFPDVNGDHIVDSNDSVIVWNASVAKGTGQQTGLSREQEEACDADMDGIITSWDATLVSKYVTAYGVGLYTNDLAGWTRFYNVQMGYKKIVADITMELAANVQATIVVHHVPSYDVHVKSTHTITSMTSYTDTTIITLTPVSTIAQTVEVNFKVYGFPISKSSHEYVRTIDANADNVITVDNQLITNGDIADVSIDAVTNWLGKQTTFSLSSFRADPAITTGMATMLGTPVYITDIKLSFTGMFRGSISGKVIGGA